MKKLTLTGIIGSLVDDLVPQTEAIEQKTETAKHKAKAKAKPNVIAEQDAINALVDDNQIAHDSRSQEVTTEMMVEAINSLNGQVSAMAGSISSGGDGGFNEAKINELIAAAGGGGGGAVGSVFGRVGAVVAAANDYIAAQITNTPSGNLAATTVQAALDELQTEIDSIVVTDEVIENAGALAGAAPAGAQWGVDKTTGQAYYVNGAGDWTAMPVSTVDLNFTVASETGNNAGAAPLNAPATPDTGDVHLELYDDFLVWWSWGGAAWANSAQTATNPALATVASPAADDAAGAVGASVKIAREDHKHPAQGVSADANNIITIGTDGLHQLPLDATGFVGNLATTDDTLQEVADKFDALVIGKDRFHADKTTVAAVDVANPTVAEIAVFTAAATKTDTLVYYTGDDLPASTPTYVYWVDNSGAVTEILSPASAGGQDRVHADETTVSPLIAGDPTSAEIQTFVTNAAITDSLVYYTGNDSANSTIVTSYWVDNSGVATHVGANMATADLSTPTTVDRAHQFDGKWFLHGEGEKRITTSVGSSFNILRSTTDGSTATGSIQSQDNSAANISAAFCSATATATVAHASMSATSPVDGFSRAIDIFNDQIRITTAAGAAQTTTKGDVLTLVDSLTGEVEFVAPVYSASFNATSDWGTASGGFYTLNILATTHGITNPAIVQVWEDVAGNFDLTMPDKVRIYANGDVEIRITEIPDDRFAGKISIR